MILGHAQDEAIGFYEMATEKVPSARPVVCGLFS